MKKDKQFDKWFKFQFKRLPMSITEVKAAQTKANELSKELEIVTQQLYDDRVIQEMYRTAVYTKLATKCKKPFSF
jgi:hypothetical protein